MEKHENCINCLQLIPLEKLKALRNNKFVCHDCLGSLEGKLMATAMLLDIPQFEHQRITWKRIENHELSEEDRRRLWSDYNAIKIKLRKIYDFHTKRPPDWSERKIDVMDRDGHRCKYCDRNMRKSVVESHIHHVIPLTDKRSNHTLGNLILLCEICHSKIDNHEIIKKKRSNKLGKKRITKTESSNNNGDGNLLVKLGITL